jgi:hypothetical protein
MSSFPPAGPGIYSGLRVPLKGTCRSLPVGCATPNIAYRRRRSSTPKSTPKTFSQRVEPEAMTVPPLLFSDPMGQLPLSRRATAITVRISSTLAGFHRDRP